MVSVVFFIVIMHFNNVVS